MRQGLQLAIAKHLASAYSALMPIFGVIALGGLVLAVVGAPFRSLPTGLTGLALACATAVAARITLLVYLDVTSFPSLNQNYLSPASPFMITFVFLGVYLGSIAFVHISMKKMPPIAPKEQRTRTHSRTPVNSNDSQGSAHQQR